MRDLQKDLEIIRAATSGKWEYWDFDCPDYDPPRVGLWITVGKFPGQVICSFGLNPSEQDYKNAKAIVEAHNGGWSEAIQRALSAEAQVQKLKARYTADVLALVDKALHAALSSLKPGMPADLWTLHEIGMKKAREVLEEGDKRDDN